MRISIGGGSGFFEVIRRITLGSRIAIMQLVGDLAGRQVSRRIAKNQE